MIYAGQAKLDLARAFIFYNALPRQSERFGTPISISHPSFPAPAQNWGQARLQLENDPPRSIRTTAHGKKQLLPQLSGGIGRKNR